MAKKSNLLVEPRVFWDVASILPSDATNVPRSRVRLDDGNFYNGSKYPIELRYILLSAINYTFRELEDLTAVSTTTYDNDMAVLNKCEFYIEAPRRQQLVIGDVAGSLYSRAPSANPGMQYGAIATASDIWGVTRWDFDPDMKLVLPRKADIRFRLTGFTVPDAMGGTFLDNFTDNPNVSYIFNEDADNHFGGSSRLKDRFNLRVPTGDGALPFPRGSQPFRADGFGAENAGFSAQILTTTDAWPPQHDFTTREFGMQESNRGTEKNTFSGFAVAIEQTNYDAAFAFAGGGAGAGLTTAPVTPISCKVGCRAKVEVGGTGEWWWRPGAPLCLVCPTLTPALVHRLKTPIVLGPGEGLFVEVQAPLTLVISSGGEPISINPRYNVGISLAGHAIVEG